MFRQANPTVSFSIMASGNTARLSLAFSIAAFVLSAATLYRVSGLEQTDRAETKSAYTVAEVPESRRISAATVNQKARVSSVNSEQKIPKKATNQEPERLPKSVAQRDQENWNVSYRGAEKVINIGEDLDVDGFYFDPVPQGDTVNIGKDLDPDLDW